MPEVSLADLRSAPSEYQSSRALSDVLIGNDTALPLFEASSTGDITALQRILEESPEIALESPHRIYGEDRPAKDRDDVRRVFAMRLFNVDRAITRAAENGHVAAVSTLLDFASRYGVQASSIIHRDTVKIALQNGHADVFDVLATADPTVASHSDIHPLKRPLDWAIEINNIELVKVILQHGGGRALPLTNPPRASYGPQWGSRLCQAAKRTKNLTELLISHGHAVKGSGALQSAAQWGRLDVVRFLAEEHGADVNERLSAETLPRVDNALYASWTPMHFAASRAGEEAVKLLEKYGAKADVLDVMGRTPFQLMQEWKQDKSYTKNPCKVDFYNLVDLRVLDSYL